MSEYVMRKEVVQGELISRTYFTVRKPQHYFVKFQGFGISESIIRDLNRKGCEFVLIKYYAKDGHTVAHRSKLADWIIYGARWTDTTQGKTDLQYILPIKMMQQEV